MAQGAFHATDEESVDEVVRMDEEGMREGVARCPSCSQSAHDKNVLVRCAQSRAASATLLNRGIGAQKTLVRLQSAGWTLSATKRLRGCSEQPLAKRRVFRGCR